MNHFEKFESYIPTDLNTGKSFFIACLILFAMILFRYFLVTGIFYLAFYRFPSPARSARLIYSKLPTNSMQLFEIKWSIIGTSIFAFTGAALGLAWQNGWTQIYLRFDAYPWWWMGASILITSVIHDLYFYWTHRLLHTKWLFQKVHFIHHASLTPSPWASFSFHPVESLIEAIPLPLIVCVIPMHPVVIITYLTMMTLSAVINHLGFEVLPQGSAHHFIGRWLISGVHHSEHHRIFTKNYALFYNWWDRIHKTQYPQYPTEFDQICGGKNARKNQ